MSTDLIYTRKIKGGDFSKELKWAVEKKFRLPYQVGYSEIGFFEGLAAAGLKDAEKIIKAIAKYDQITLELE